MRINKKIYLADSFLKLLLLFYKKLFSNEKYKLALIYWFNKIELVLDEKNLKNVGLISISKRKYSPMNKKYFFS